MYDRDHCKILNDVINKAVEQLHRKCQFLIDNQEYFKKIYLLEGKNIIKVIILNILVYTGAIVEGIPIIDINFFLSYFRTGKLTKRAFGTDEMEEVDSVPYYTTEDEFCNNLESYLKEPPMTKMYSDQLEIIECSNKIDGLPEIFFSDISPVDKKSMLIEGEEKIP